jgi:hypothetical protein
MKTIKFTVTVAKYTRVAGQSYSSWAWGSDVASFVGVASTIAMARANALRAFHSSSVRGCEVRTETCS